MDRDKSAGPLLPVPEEGKIQPAHAAHARCEKQRPAPPSPSTDAAMTSGVLMGMPVAGDVIDGKYRIDGIMGRGGMSVVYRATHLELDQEVAIKVLSAAALVLPEYVVRLKREARAASRIRSEHVVRVHDVGELDGRGIPYLVMECLGGSDLAAILTRRGPLPVRLAIECVVQTLEALAEAHTIGIIHRDLKPANLFLTESVDGSPCIKVLDFGISRTIRRPALSPLTDPGTVLGTPSYMAPEQMEASDRVDARSDIWALGAILYELLVGHPPYEGEGLPAIFMKIMRAPPRKASSFRADVSPELDAIIARCLSIEPERRYQSVGELAWALAELGSTRMRDAAERISRVLDHKGRSENSVTLASAAVRLRRPWSVRRVARAMLAGATASVAVLAVALALSGRIPHHLGGADETGASLGAEHPMNAAWTTGPREDEALSISLRTRAERSAPTDDSLGVRPVGEPRVAPPAKATTSPNAGTPDASSPTSSSTGSGNMGENGSLAAVPVSPVASDPSNLRTGAENAADERATSKVTLETN